MGQKLKHIMFIYMIQKEIVLTKVYPVERKKTKNIRLDSL